MKHLAIFASHPVPYHVPYYRSLVAAGVDVDVGFYHEGTSGKAQYDSQFGLAYSWDVDLLSGYKKTIFLSHFAKFTFQEQLRLSVYLVPWFLRRRRVPVLLMGWFSEVIWVSWALRTLFRMPTLQMCETTPLSFASTTKPRWRIGLLRWLLRNCSAVLYIGSRNRQFFMEMGVPEDRLFPAPYSIANQFLAESAGKLMQSRRELCLKHGLDPDLPVILFCGKLIPKKRPLELLNAYFDSGLRHRAQILFVGEGPLRAALENRAREGGVSRVHFLGFLNYTETPLAYVLGELLCLLSDSTETWGLVVNEAMACGRPVIVAESVGCVPDLVTEDTGWRVPLDDKSALMKALRQALDNYDHWGAMGEAGRRRIVRHSHSAMAAGTRSALASFGADT